MDKRAKVPVSLPHANPTTSYWQDPPDAIADHRTTPNLPSSADTVIIGSGITGAAVAWDLLQGENPGSILMLEARQACSGATGRNGGHTKAASYRSFAHHAATLSLSAAKQIARLELANILAVHSFAREHNIPCALNPCHTIDIIYDAAQWADACAAVAAMRAAFSDADTTSSKDGNSNSNSTNPTPGPEGEYTLYSREEAMAQFHACDHVYNGAEQRVQGGVGYFAGSLSAYQFGIGVLKLCLGRGMQLQTNTPVVEIKRRQDGDGDGGGGGAWEVLTPRGTVRAKRVVLATNGYTAAVWPRFQGVIVPLRGQVTAQRPGSGLSRGGRLPTTYSFIYERGYEYMVATPEGSRHPGDIVIGGGLVRAPDDGLMEFGTTDDSVLNEGISDYLRESTRRYFGPHWGEDAPEGRVRREWTGVMGFSPDGFPFVGEVPGQSGLWVSSSFQGHGMVLCWMCARALVEMMEGRDGEELREWFPDVFRVSEERLAQRFQGRLDAIPRTGEETTSGRPSDG